MTNLTVVLMLITCDFHSEETNAPLKHDRTIWDIWLLTHVSLLLTHVSVLLTHVSMVWCLQVVG